MKALILALVCAVTIAPPSKAKTYSVWSEGDTLHLIMSDNGTPDDYDDDWVVDWEDNREYKVIILDKGD